MKRLFLLISAALVLGSVAQASSPEEQAPCREAVLTAFANCMYDTNGGQDLRKYLRSWLIVPNPGPVLYCVVDSSSPMETLESQSGKYLVEVGRHPYKISVVQQSARSCSVAIEDGFASLGTPQGAKEESGSR